MEEIIIDTLEANKMETNIHIRFIVSRGVKKTPYQHPQANIGGPTIVVIPEHKIASVDVKKNGIRCYSTSFHHIPHGKNEQRESQ